jgi:predicted amidophosphoribosyltransferase
MTMRPIAELLAVVVPPACAACRSPLPRADLLLCAPCTRALPWLPRRACPRCALPSHRRTCPAAGAAFRRAWSPLAYDGVARDLVAALKFRAALPLATLMAAHLAANLPADLRPMAIEPDLRRSPIDPDLRPAQTGPGPVARGRPPIEPDPVAVVAVPAQPARRRRRGFDPAGVLAVALARRLGVAHEDCLRRRDRGGRQVGASRSQRRRAGRLAIELRGPPPARALLVDDVHTTGATLDACARALVGGGSRDVVALTYARTL